MIMEYLMNRLKEKHYYIIGKTLASIFILFSFLYCSNDVKVDERDITKKDSSISLIQIADTIIYDVLIENPDNDDTWKEHCLKNLNKEPLVDFLFESVYQKQAKAYHYYTNKEFTIKEVREIENEPEFSREKIAKIQFVEEWLLDTTNFKMYKEIHSVMLGYEVRSESGEIKGYKPTFRIYFK